MLMSPHIKLRYINSVDEELLLAPFSIFWCEKCTEDLTNQIHSQKQVATHGKFFTGMSLDERHITITGFVMHEMGMHLANDTLQSIFNPTLSGTLYFENSLLDIKRDILCRVEELPTVYWSNKQLKFDISLVCLDPFWKGQDITELIGQTIKKFKFQVAIPRGGMSFGIDPENFTSEFENAGNVESGFHAIIRAAKGTVVNPELRNELTGEKIKLNYTLQQYDILTITSTLQEKRVEINGINAFKHINAEVTTFFKIAVGTNIVGYFADENISNMSVKVIYPPYYTHAEVI